VAGRRLAHSGRKRRRQPRPGPGEPSTAISRLLPARIEVQKDDLVQVRFTAKDIAHSFTVDVPYRISKRAGAGQSVVFEFRADEAGRFTFYCNLTQDERCKQMKGELVVR
jgi:heme/copper-type cytochrome/quinol oxidase subunit 2